MTQFLNRLGFLTALGVSAVLLTATGRTVWTLGAMSILMGFVIGAWRARRDQRQVRDDDDRSGADWLTLPGGGEWMGAEELAKVEEKPKVVEMPKAKPAEVRPRKAA